jgi:hypothetical protein
MVGRGSWSTWRRCLRASSTPPLDRACRASHRRTASAIAPCGVGDGRSARRRSDAGSQADGDHNESVRILPTAGRKVRTASRYRRAEIQRSNLPVRRRPVAGTGSKRGAARSHQARSHLRHRRSHGLTLSPRWRRPMSARAAGRGEVSASKASVVSHDPRAPVKARSRRETPTPPACFARGGKHLATSASQAPKA